VQFSSTTIALLKFYFRQIKLLHNMPSKFINFNFKLHKIFPRMNFLCSKIQNRPILAGGGIRSGSDFLHLLDSMKSNRMSVVTGSLILPITPIAVL